jgi:flavin reductase (DIM6/NTAB) family NADH-FMN oxidoreductase RutF
MRKLKIDQRFSPYQMPCAIIGTIVKGKPNFMLCTWLSRVNRNPPIWMVSINRKHYSMKGIKLESNFSLNFPSTDLIMQMDYIGIYSGKDKDKSLLFNLFYGETKVPMIMDCPLTIELSIIDLIELSDHFIVLGTAINSYFDEKCQTNGVLDIKKMKPVIYTGIEKNQTYWSVGEKLGDAFKLGKGYKNI